MSYQDNVALGPLVAWEMPCPLGPFVRYFPNSTGDPPSYGVVVSKGDSTIDIMVVSPNSRGLIPKSAVRHAEDPNNWKHRSYMGGIWLDTPFNVRMVTEIKILKEEILALRSQLSDLQGQLE